MFAHKRFYALKTIIANIALCILGAGFVYGAALMVYRKQTGRQFFLDQTHSEKRVQTIDSEVMTNRAQTPAGA
jgi:uncharacterized protein YxeA